MHYTARVRGLLARHLLAHPNEKLRRRLSVLRATPFPPGSRSLASDDVWYELASRFRNLQGFVYGSNRDALVYTFDADQRVLTVELAVVEGQIVPAARQ